MPDLIKNVVLDICKHQSPSVPVFVLRQGDNNSVTLEISIVEDGQPFDLADYDARFMAQLGGGKAVIDECAKTGGNGLSYTLPSALSAKPGLVSLAYIAVYRNEEWVASTDCMHFKVLPGADLSAEEAESYIGEFEAMRSRIEGLVEEAENRMEDQQEAWKEQMATWQSEWERQMTDQQGAWEVRMQLQQQDWRDQTMRQQSEWEAQMEDQQSFWQSRTEAQQSKWETQMESQRSEFEEQEAARAEAEAERASAEQARVAAEARREEAVAKALASMEGAAVVSITDPDIDALWVNE